MGCGWTREEHQEVAHDRVHLGRPRGGAGVAGFAGVEPEAAAGARGWGELVLRCANERGERLAGRYAVRGAS